MSAGISKATVIERLDELIGAIEGDEKARKRARILDTAAELFAEQGYRRTSIDAVAERAGVGKGTVYLYFERKIDLLIAAIAREKKEALSRFAFLFDPSFDARARLQTYVETVLLALIEMPLQHRLLTGDADMAAVFEDLPAELQQQSEGDKAEFLGPMIVDAVGAHGWSEDELLDRVNVVMGSLFMGPQMLESHVRGGSTPQRFAAVFAEMLVAGLRQSAAESLEGSPRRATPSDSANDPPSPLVPGTVASNPGPSPGASS